jgi:hypothetical protein
MTVGATVRIRPGLKNRPAISGREVTVLEIVNDRVRVQAGHLNTWVRKEDVQR